MRTHPLFAQLFARLAQLFAFVLLLGVGGCVEGGADFDGPLKKRPSDAALGDDAWSEDPENPAPPPPPSGGDTQGIPCAVETVLRDRCQSCHGATPKYGAPMPLVRYEDMIATTPTKPGKTVHAEVAARVHDDAKPMPQSPTPRLTAAELAAIDGWSAAGAPRGERCRDSGDAGPPPPVEEPLGCTPDVFAKPKSKWTMPVSEKDVYACYGFEQPVSAKRHATAFRIKVDNTKIVHHVLVFQSDKAESPTPHACSAASLASWRMVYGWSPGSKGRELPAEAGIPVEGTTHWVVQVHYNNVKGLSGETDETGFDMCTTDKLRKYDADMLVYGTMKLDIPAKSKLDITCTLKPTWMPPIHIVSGSPHMHGLGRIMTTTLKKKDGTTVDLGSAPAFDWGNQQSYPVTPGTVVDSGDTVITRCVWQNDTASNVQWGEGTADEMCYSFTMYYPKIEQSLWSWVAPALMSSCTSTK